MRGRHFSWKNFSKFVGATIAVIFWVWIFWSFIDVNLHNEKHYEYPSEYNAFVLYYNLLESATR